MMPGACICMDMDMVLQPGACMGLQPDKCLGLQPGTCIGLQPRLHGVAVWRRRCLGAAACRQGAASRSRSPHRAAGRPPRRCLQRVGVRVRVGVGGRVRVRVRVRVRAGAAAPLIDTQAHSHALLPLSCRADLHALRSALHAHVHVGLLLLSPLPPPHYHHQQQLLPPPPAPPRPPPLSPPLRPPLRLPQVTTLRQATNPCASASTWPQDAAAKATRLGRRAPG